MLFTVALPALAAELDEYIISREVLRDPSREIPFEAVRAAAFTPENGVFAGGYTSDIIWMRLSIKPAPERGQLVLRILPAYLNSVTLYEPDPDHPGNWRIQETGNRIAWRQRPLGMRALGFNIEPKVQTTVYLRLDTVTNALLDVHAFEPAQAAQRELLELLWQMLYMAIIFWLILWALQDYWLNRDRLVLGFALAYLIYLLYVLAILGFLPMLLPDVRQIPDLTATMVTLAVFSSVVFHRSVLNLYQISRPARGLLNALLGSGVCAIGLLVIGQTAATLKLNSVLALLAGPLLFLAALTARGDLQPGPRQLRIYYALLAATLISYVAPLLGLSQGGTWTLYGALVQGLVSSIVFGHLLHARSRQMLEKKIFAERQLILAENQLIQHQAQLAEQHRFAHLLTHEIKNPLASIRFSLDAMARAGTPEENRRHQRIDCSQAAPARACRCRR
jgi:signal transduction histidine kinase